MEDELKDWMNAATTHEQTRLAELAGTSHTYLYDLSNGRRKISVELAAQIEAASKIINRETKKRLPVLYRMLLSETCSTCPYARKCKKKVTV